MDQRVTFYTRSTATNTMGEKTFSFSEGDTRWATAEILSTYEGAENKEIRETQNVKFTMRYYGSATENMRLFWVQYIPVPSWPSQAGRYYDITSVQHDGRYKYTTIIGTYKD